MQRTRRLAIAVLASAFLILGAAFGMLGMSTTTEGFFTGSTQSVLADIRTPVHICNTCGAPHGGVYHPNYCHHCISKGITPVKPG